MGNDRDRFTEDASGLPVYEGRMVDHYDYRAKAYRSGRGRAAVWEPLPFGHPNKAIIPQWFVPRSKIPEKVGDRPFHYRVVWCDVATPTAARSLVAALVPPGVVCGDTTPTIRFERDFEWAYMPWLGVANSLCMDFLARKKISLHLKYTHMDSLPFPQFALESEMTQAIGPLALRLTCTSKEMSGYWNAMTQFGWCEPVELGSDVPGITDVAQRDLAIAKIDALVASLVFNLSRSDYEFVIDSFEVLKKQEIASFREFRTKRLVLEAFDKLSR